MKITRFLMTCVTSHVFYVTLTARAWFLRLFFSILLQKYGNRLYQIWGGADGFLGKSARLLSVLGQGRGAQIAGKPQK